MVKKLVVLFFLMCILYPTLSFSQMKKMEANEKREPATKIEQFLSKKGRLYLKDFFNAGTVSGNHATSISVKALIIYEPGKDAQKIRGLKIEVYESGGRLEKSNSSFLDIDEAESLSKAIEYMINLIDKFKNSYREYTEVIFSTKGEFEVGFYQKDSAFTAFVSSGYISKVTCFLPVESLLQLKSVIDDGLSMAKK